MTADFDEYSEVINGPNTYAAIAETLLLDRALLVGWTDGHYSHLDVLFTLRPSKVGNIQRGLHLSRQILFVSIVGRSCFGFDAFDRNGDLHPHYVGEKLDLGDNVTTDGLTELINGVLDALDTPAVAGTT